MTGVVIGVAAALAAILAAVLVLRKRRVTPEERERRRRAELLDIGRSGDGILTDVREDGMLEYAYDVRGVTYRASQDTSNVREQLPPEPWTLIGPATIRYHPRNPANSMVLSEEWSGLRVRPSRSETSIELTNQELEHPELTQQSGEETK